jgi:hypothetical protein
MNGCETPVETPATWLGPEEEFYNCPIRFITAGTYKMIEKMDSYAEGFSTPPDYDNQSARFLEGVRLFKHYLNHFIALKQGT